MVLVGHIDHFPPGGSVRLALDPPIAVFRAESGEFFAIDDTCSHQDVPLSDGWVEGCRVVCPLHEAEFDLRTGAALCGPARRGVRTHEVVVDDGRISVLVSSAPIPAPATRVRIAS